MPHLAQCNRTWCKVMETRAGIWWTAVDWVPQTSLALISVAWEHRWCSVWGISATHKDDKSSASWNSMWSYWGHWQAIGGQWILHCKTTWHWSAQPRNTDIQLEASVEDEYTKQQKLKVTPKASSHADKPPQDTVRVERCWKFSWCSKVLHVYSTTYIYNLVSRYSQKH